MQFFSSLFAWANVPFTVALCVALLFALLQVTGVLGLLAGDADGDADADADVDADVDADADADADHDADADGDQDHDADDAGGKGLLEGLGVGKVPISIVWQTFAATFGLTGITVNTLYAARAGSLPPYTLAWAAPVALLSGYWVTRTLSGMLGRVLSDPKQDATSRTELVGRTATVISTRVSAEFGEVRLRDKDQWIYLVCRTREAEPVILEGREVVVVEHERETDRLYVAPLDEEVDLRPRGRHRAATRQRIAATVEEPEAEAIENEAPPIARRAP